MFTLYGRGWCHLCDDMRDALAPVAAEYGVAVEIVDVDDDPALVARYDEDVPVLLLDGAEVCRHRFDEPRVRGALEARRSVAADSV
ncbi:glutaredoxin family protein [Burkholderia guangdongensis]|uniref:glutaredoxin family protein n=1 Tax=Burkholderia guangdongensis TaxID=1792500 RepID=UPI0015C711E6|nr:glutaredoxin family protein [Burkholderia guangdongensis]